MHKAPACELRHRRLVHKLSVRLAVEGDLATNPVSTPGSEAVQLLQAVAGADVGAALFHSPFSVTTGLGDSAFPLHLSWRDHLL